MLECQTGFIDLLSGKRLLALQIIYLFRNFLTDILIYIVKLHIFIGPTKRDLNGCGNSNNRF